MLGLAPQGHSPSWLRRPCTRKFLCWGFRKKIQRLSRYQRGQDVFPADAQNSTEMCSVPRSERVRGLGTGGHGSPDRGAESGVKTAKKKRIITDTTPHRGDKKREKRKYIFCLFLFYLLWKRETLGLDDVRTRRHLEGRLDGRTLCPHHRVGDICDEDLTS